MNKILLLPVILSFACSGEEKEKPHEKSPDTTSTEASFSIPDNTEYRYEITNIRTGEVKDISQEEYLSGDYIDNPTYTVTEHPVIK
ncbi:MAG: hypothetical protein ACOZCO_12755 [Bacteroidota bacterium]